MDRDTTSSDRKCPRCGSSELRPIAHRVTNFVTPGYLNLFHCQSCGRIEQNEIAHEPPGKRT